MEKKFVAPEVSNEEDKKRYLKEKRHKITVCPFNPSHSIKVRNYAKHCRGCPDNPACRPGYNAPYLNKGCNVPQFEFEQISNDSSQLLLDYLDDEFFLEKTDGCTNKKSKYYDCKCSRFVLSDFPVNNLEIEKKRIRALYNYVCNTYPDITKPVLSNPAIGDNDEDPDVVAKTIAEETISMPESWDYSIKHSCQCFSIIGHLNDLGIIKTCYTNKPRTQEVTHVIEGGAGTGMLSAYISLINSDPDAKNRIKAATEAELRAAIDESNQTIDNKGQQDQEEQVVQQNLYKNLRGSNGFCPSSATILPLSKHQRIFYLIERTTGYKRKFDRYCRSCGEPTVRVPADLSDVDLKKLIDVETPKHLLKPAYKLDGKQGVLSEEIMHMQTNTPNHVAVIGKHLCGSATDITLKMAIDSCSDEAKSLKLDGIGIALCCHSKGDGHMYINQEFFRNLGVSTLELTVIHRICSWALAFRDEYKEEENSDDDEYAADDSNRQETAKPITPRSVLLPGDDRREIGEMAKTVLNVGRIVWLKGQKIVKDAGLVKYIEKQKSPENVLLWCVGK